MPRSARVLTVAFLALCCASSGASPRELSVIATAYNSVPEQTWGDPMEAAWGDRLDRLEPGTKVIAVSRDLLELGLRRGTRVKIVGLPGEYLVLDKLARRWTNRIDIYMGMDVQAARNWGKRRVTIRWQPAE